MSGLLFARPIFAHLHPRAAEIWQVHARIALHTLDARLGLDGCNITGSVQPGLMIEPRAADTVGSSACRARTPNVDGLQARGALKKQLIDHLRSQRPIRRSGHATKKGKRLGQIVDAVSISERPASTEDRAVPGHWEGDLSCGSKNSFIVTLVERHSRYLMLAKIPNKNTETVVNALIKQARKLPDELYKSLTWDRGKELADHRRFTMETDVAVYFCDPQSPWQRGSNENTNRLLRRYFPRGTGLAPHSQVELNRIARRLNERPRKTLDFHTSAERFSECVASIG